MAEFRPIPREISCIEQIETQFYTNHTPDVLVNIKAGFLHAAEQYLGILAVRYHGPNGDFLNQPVPDDYLCKIWHQFESIHGSQINEFYNSSGIKILRPVTLPPYDEK